MGQYYHPISLDKKEWLLSHDYNHNGLKLTEHSYIGNTFMKAVESLLVPGGNWYMTRIVWAGDYADNFNFLDSKQLEFCKGCDEEKNLYDFCIRDISEEKEFNILSLSIIKISPNPIKKSPRYILNHNKNLFVDKYKVKKDKDGFRFHPLSLLTCDGNGRGGGDFHGDDKYIGIWAGNVISMEYKKPKNFVEFIPEFKE